ncbi:MAG: hypothetical protein M1828_002196 [Chrysothrix sp. TS-e1954]|nr:MAG: hypothetical protein M1828_002196 [Chrysothrix sp. TS-e1954]
MPISPTDEYRRECIDAAYASRLDPFALLVQEYDLLGSFASIATVAYLEIRNAILRLWRRNPSIVVSRDEALSTAREARHRPCALLAHEFLTRQGYINYGCLEVPETVPLQEKGLDRSRIIVIIGAGVAGLSCARHLQGLIKQFPEKWLVGRRESLPKVVLLEGRDRIGGRVYSHPLLSNGRSSLPHGLSSAAELGAHIITGFEHGNPLDAVIRGQLCLHYHLLTDNIMLRDHDGSPVDESRDKKMQRLYDDIIEAASPYAWDYKLPQPSNGTWPGPGRKPRGHMSCKNNIKRNGFKAKAASEYAEPCRSLGSFMSSSAAQNQQSRGLCPQSMRLLNWHFADLEYAYAARLDRVSLGGWDQDSGNEFEGRHSQIVGGYTQVVRGLWKYPSPLDVHLGQRVRYVHWEEKPVECATGLSARVDCEDGRTYDADYVVSTLPLGVYKWEHWDMFQPELPLWKQRAIDRTGFGLLNKIVLVFDHVFWNRDRDIFGYLNQSNPPNSTRQQDYVEDRGRCYFFWNCVKTSGVPMLIGLMAGDAADAAERSTDASLIEEATEKLARMFQLSEPPQPVEAIVTRWLSDEFSRGTYSHPGTVAKPGDYEKIAQKTGNLYFAGEATSVSYPATVHGAFLSGIRAAAELMESMVGPERLVMPV